MKQSVIIMEEAEDRELELVSAIAHNLSSDIFDPECLDPDETLGKYKVTIMVEEIS